MPSAARTFHTLHSTHDYAHPKGAGDSKFGPLLGYGSIKEWRCPPELPPGKLTTGDKGDANGIAKYE